MTLLYRDPAIVLAVFLLHACGSDGGAGAAPSDAASSDDFPGCTAGEVEADLQPSPLEGPGVQDGAVAPGTYVVSSTYLQVRPDRLARFDELMGPILNDLAARPGLLAISLANSQSCGSARTLTVWSDAAAMLGFVTSDAHMAAMRSISEVSRGGSVVTHWSGDQDSARWEAVGAYLAADEGPRY